MWLVSKATNNASATSCLASSSAPVRCMTVSFAISNSAIANSSMFSFPSTVKEGTGFCLTEISPISASISSSESSSPLARPGLYLSIAPYLASASLNFLI
ncbi:hypothetical protein Droror1_Dr00004632 [Drosera rotundifolia]